MSSENTNGNNKQDDNNIKLETLKALWTFSWEITLKE